MKTVIKMLATAATALAASAAMAAPVTDGGFEAQGAAATGNYCYFGMATPGGPACSPSMPWNGTTGAGLQIETNSAWPGAQTPDGNYYGFIQGLGAIAQTVSIAAATTFTLSWLDAGRPQGGANDGNQQYNVTVSGLNGTQTLFTGATTSFQAFGSKTSGQFVLGAGNYLLSFNGLTSTGDHTAFIDAVSLNAAVPEPATWAMMLLGFGAMGTILRRRRRESGPRMRFA